MRRKLLGSVFEIQHLTMISHMEVVQGPEWHGSPIDLGELFIVKKNGRGVEPGPRLTSSRLAPRRECLDHFIPLNERHLRKIVADWCRRRLTTTFRTDIGS